MSNSCPEGFSIITHLATHTVNKWSCSLEVCYSVAN